MAEIGHKKFTENPLEWPAFWDSFESLVHKQKALANVEKFCYLRNMLEGVPYSMIAESNYEEAVKLLRERFGRRDLIVNSHMDKHQFNQFYCRYLGGKTLL